MSSSTRSSRTPTSPATTPSGSNFTQKQWPRLNKPTLAKLRSAEVDLKFPLLAIDIDNPGHLPWASDDAVKHFFESLEHASKEFPLSTRWWCAYTTRHGARLVYILDYAITAEEYEAKHQWLCQQLSRYGIEADMAVSDWTRIFRAPFVLRDGRPSHEDPHFTIKYQTGHSLDPELLGSASRQKASQYSAIVPVEGPQPPLSCRSRLLTEVGARGRPVMSEWLKAAKQRLVNRDCFKVVFQDFPIGTAGERNNNIHKHVGQAVSLLFNVEGTTPEHIYALFLEAVQRLEPDEDTPDWTALLWDHVKRLWAKEDAKERYAKQVAEESMKRAEEKALDIVAGMKEWCSDPRLYSKDASEVAGFIGRRMLAQHQKNYYPLQRDGTYTSSPLLKEQVIPWIRSKGMDDLIPTQTTDPEKGVREIDVTQIINTHAYPVIEVNGVPSNKGGHITKDDRLVVPLFRLNPDLAPAYSAEVDQWLMMLFGEDYSLACKWIAYALAFEDGPICAISIKGDPGVGKKLFIQGLAECLENPWVADAQDIVSDYQYGLLRSPFLAVNEGWPSGPKHHPADTFRRLVGGDGFIANQKYMSPVRVKNPARIVFAANNLDVVGFLTAGRDLSVEDREALQIRLLHFNVGDQAASWLRAKGGVRFTGGWIEGDGGRPSDFTIAKHFLHLHQTRAELGAPGGRLLVEGTKNSELMVSMQTQSGKSPLVIEVVLKMLKWSVRTNRPRGVVVSGGEIYAVSSEILDYYREKMSKAGMPELSLKSISSVLKGLSKETAKRPFLLDDAKHAGRRRWFKLDKNLLYEAVVRDGWECRVLEEMVASENKGLMKDWGADP
jgi:hypothetical protein